MVQIYEQPTLHGIEFVQQHAQQYVFEKGLKIFGEKGEEAAKTELDQLHRRLCFAPISVAELTKDEKRKAQYAIMLLTEKRSGEIKGRAVYNGKSTRNWLTKEDTTSPTTTQEGLMITTVIDATEERDQMSNDVPNAFIQAEIPADLSLIHI